MGLSNFNNMYSNDGIMGNYDLDLVNYGSIDKSDSTMYYSQDSIYIPEENTKLVASNKYNNDLSIYGGSLVSDSKIYRKTELKFRFYRICENLFIKNPDRIYDMYIKRHINRKRLESSSNKLELVIAALFYIDQRMNTSNSYTIKDILTRIPDCKVNLKQFTKLVSKISKELGIENLPNIDDSSIIGNLMEQIRTYLIENINKNDKDVLVPKSTTSVIGTMDEIFNLGGLVESNTYDSLEMYYTDNNNNNINNNDGNENKDINNDTSTNNSKNKEKEKDDNDIEKDSSKSTPRSSPKRILNEINRYKVIYRNLSCNYEKIEKFCLRILRLVDDPSSSENVLDPKNRVIFSCRKTLISCTLLLGILSVKIPFNSNMLIKALKLSRTSFYRNFNKLVSKLILLLSKQYNCKINSIGDLLLLILVPIEKENKNINKDDNKDKSNDGNNNNRNKGNDGNSNSTTSSITLSNTTTSTNNSNNDKENGNNSKDKEKEKEEMNEKNIKENKKKIDVITNQVLKVGNVLNGCNGSKNIKNTKFNMVVSCLDFLNESQSKDKNKKKDVEKIETNLENVEKENNVNDEKINGMEEKEDEKVEKDRKRIHNLYYDSNRCKYICRYNLKGEYKRKTFSVNCYGRETAYNMARCFLKNVAS